MNTTDILTANQLLGRLVYFHVLFIDPALPTSWTPPPSTTCCHHDRREPQPPTRIDLRATPWAALTQINDSLGGGACRENDSDRCCPACRIHACAAAVADCWIVTEHHAYCDDPLIHDDTRRAWSDTVADRITAVFSRLYQTPCAWSANAHTASQPPAGQFPLTGELAALWSETSRATPVISWLNHCAGLDDIARHLRRRSSL
ncbi:hypothetical protein [Nocardia gipuzkoensis]